MFHNKIEEVEYILFKPSNPTYVFENVLIETLFVYDL